MAVDQFWINEVLECSKGHGLYKPLYIGPHVNKDKGKEYATCGYSIHLGDFYGNTDNNRKLTKGRKERCI
jgi:hypothetical protein